MFTRFPLCTQALLTCLCPRSSSFLMSFRQYSATGMPSWPAPLCSPPSFSNSFYPTEVCRVLTSRQVVKYKTLLLISAFKKPDMATAFRKRRKSRRTRHPPGHFLPWTVLRFSSPRVNLMNELKVICFQRGHELDSCENETSTSVLEDGIGILCHLRHVPCGHEAERFNK